MAPFSGYRTNTLRGDRRAVEGLPLTMIIVMVVLAITIPLIFGSLRAYDRGRMEAELVSEMNGFASMAQLIYTSGPGNSALIEFMAEPGSIAGINYVIFGDVPGGGLASTIRYKIQGIDEQMMLISSPLVPMMSNQSAGLQISSGAYKILAECVAGYYNPDDPSQQTYVRLSIYQ